jgi:hypothetical protein
MSAEEQWVANQGFLDSALEAGSRIILATPPELATGSYLLEIRSARRLSGMDEFLRELKSEYAARLSRSNTARGSCRDDPFPPPG